MTDFSKINCIEKANLSERFFFSLICFKALLYLFATILMKLTGRSNIYETNSRRIYVYISPKKSNVSDSCMSCVCCRSSYVMICTRIYPYKPIWFRIDTIPILLFICICNLYLTFPRFIPVWMYIEYISTMIKICLLYTSPSPRDRQKSRMPSSA